MSPKVDLSDQAKLLSLGMDENKIEKMAQYFPQAQHFVWDQTDSIVAEVHKRSKNTPIILIGQGLGGDKKPP